MKKKAYSRGTDSVPALLTPHEAVLNRKGADIIGRGNIQKANAMGNMMERYQRGTSDVGRDDRADLLREADATFYGGGNAPAPAPTPTPTPKPRGYQYGTNNVRAMDYTASPPGITSGAQGFGGAPTAAMGGSGNLSTISVPTSGSGPMTGGTPYIAGGTGGYPSAYNSPIAGANPTPAGNPGNINVTAGSKGTSPLSTPIPDLRYADPNTLSRLQGGMDGLIYNPAGGGYRYSDNYELPGSQVLQQRYIGNTQPANFVDPAANRAASAYYNYIGGLPTRPVGTPALNQLYGMTGQSPTPGPSYNSILSQYANNTLAKQAGFGPTYKGPYGFGG